MVSKHSTLPTGKLVLVSASGFSTSAITRARALGVETYTLEKATEADWHAIVGETNPPLSFFSFRLVGCTLLLLANDGAAEYPVKPGAQVFESNGTSKGNLRDVILPWLRSDSFGKGAMEFLKDDNAGAMGVEIRHKPNIFVADNAGCVHEVKAIRAYVEFHTHTEPVDLELARWRGMPVAHGSVATPVGIGEVTVIELPSGELAGCLTVAGSRAGRSRTISLKRPSEPTSFSLVTEGQALGDPDEV